MASPLRLTIAAAGAPDEVVDEAWALVGATFERAEVAMSRFREDSEITRANRRTSESTVLSRDLGRALAAADRAVRLTGGRFDPRIVDALERIGYSGALQAPAVGTPRTARSAPPDARILNRHGRRGPVSLPIPVDLGGIGKGLALRWATHDLDRQLAGEPTVAGYLIDAGGDIAASGSPSGNDPWAVGIENPAGTPGPLAVVAIRGRGAIATSSVQRLRGVRECRTVHHLIDPRTGEPGGEGLAAVTVAGPDPAWAEVWSKALFLEGTGGIAAVARGRGLAAWWVTEAGQLEMTAAARVRTTWVASEA